MIKLIIIELIKIVILINNLNFIIFSMSMYKRCVVPVLAGFSVLIQTDEMRS